MSHKGQPIAEPNVVKTLFLCRGLRGKAANKRKLPGSDTIALRKTEASSALVVKDVFLLGVCVCWGQGAP